MATGLKLARPDLDVWIATGDGDAMSIGGNHLIHTLRRNVGVKILMFNNRIYGLTKGQYSPTSELGKKTKSHARWARWTTRSIRSRWPSAPAPPSWPGASTSSRTTCGRRCAGAARHKGTAFVEIYQNCNIFNDKAFTYMTDKEAKDDQVIYLEHGKPLVFGKDKNKGIRMRAPRWRSSTSATASTADDCLVWNETVENPATAFLAAQLLPPHFPTALGVFRSVDVPSYEERVVDQIHAETDRLGVGKLEDLLKAGDTWTVTEPVPAAS